MGEVHKEDIYPQLGLEQPDEIFACVGQLSDVNCPARDIVAFIKTLHTNPHFIALEPPLNGHCQ